MGNKVKLRKIDGSTIENFKMLISTSGNPKELLRTLLTDYTLTKEAVEEFYQYLDKEIFSSSRMLSYALVKEFPELFDVEVWKKQPEKSISFAEAKEYRSEISVKEYKDMVVASDPSEVSAKVIEKVIGELSASEADALLENFSGVSSFDFLLENCKKIDTAIFKNYNLRKNLTNENLEEFIREKGEISLKAFLWALKTSTSHGWSLRLVKVLGPLYLVKKNVQANTEMKDALKAISENLYGSFLDLVSENSPAALSYDVLSYILEKTEPDEDCLVSNAAAFIKVNLKKELMTFATDHQMATLQRVILALGSKKI